jgi:hypothetical protein
MRRGTTTAKACWIGASIGAGVAIAALNWLRLRPLFPLPPVGLFERAAFGLCPFLWWALKPWHQGLIEFCLVIVGLNTLLYAAAFSVLGLLLSLRGGAKKSASRLT